MTSFTTILLGAPLHRDILPTLQWVEVSTTFQIPSFQIIGLPSPEVAEARDRIRSAIEAIGEEFPKRRVVLNLSPASVRKRGTGSDLAMALAVLVSQNRLDLSLRVVAWGELGLDGRVKSLGQITRTLYACWREQVDYLIFSQEEYSEAVESLACMMSSQEFSGKQPILVPVSDLKEAWDLLKSLRILEKLNPEIYPERNLLSEVSIPSGLLPLAPALERVVGVAALGSHHLLLLGPKGTGKSHALEWLIALQDGITPDHLLKTTLLEELKEFQGGTIPSRISRLPFRRVGPQVKPGALVGGVTAGGVQVGEFTLADGGLLIADELPEWSRDSREALREPLERGSVSLNRVHGSVELPARFILAGNGNLCPCGGIPASLQRVSPEGDSPEGWAPSVCHCPERIRKSYLRRLSGPVLDRVDLFFLNYGSTRSANTDIKEGERNLRLLKEKVARGMEWSRARWGGPAGIRSGVELESLLSDHPSWKKELDRIAVSSLRARHKIFRVALSLALWDEADQPNSAHFYEASCYRPENYGLL